MNSHLGPGTPVPFAPFSAIDPEILSTVTPEFLHEADFKLAKFHKTSGSNLSLQHCG